MPRKVISQTPRQFLEARIVWVQATIAATKQSRLPESWMRDTLIHLQQEIDDYRWRLEMEPPRPSPQCGWNKPFALHGETCPKKWGPCLRMFRGWRQTLNPVPFSTVSDSDRGTLHDNLVLP